MTFRVSGLGVWRPHSGLALERVDLTAEPGQVWLIAGRNGAGASTLLAALAGLTGPGERRSGTVRWGRSDLTFAHPDELAAVIGLVGEAEPTAGLPVAHLIGRSGRRAERPDGPPQVLERLGLRDLLHARMGDLTGSERIRARLAAMIVRRPGILLLDQILGALESAWRPPVCAVVREYADAGGLVLWADQDLAYAVQVADHVLELGPGGPLAADASSWRPARLPWTPMQKVASALGAEGPASRTVDGLRPLLADPLSTFDRAASGVTARGSLVPIEVGDGRQLQVDDTAPPVFLCDSVRSADALRERLWRANAVPVFPVEPHLPLRRIAREVDRLWRLTPETTLQAVTRAVPAARPASWLAWHSRGEQARLRTAFARATPSLRLLYEPFAYLDGAGADELVGQVRRDWLGGCPALVVTTDVDAAARFPRVIVWNDDQVADGRPEAVLDHFPATPLVAQLVTPHRIVDVDDLLVHFEGCRV